MLFTKRTIWKIILRFHFILMFWVFNLFKIINDNF